MAVNQPLNLMFFHHLDYRLRVNVHDGHRFAAVGGFTARTHFGSDAIANKQRQGEKQGLDPGSMHFGAKRQIAGIVGAECIAVHD
jgi:hypothetical protein